MDKKIFITIAAVCIMLTGCGNKNDTSSADNGSKVAGGAVTKVTTQEEDTAAEESKAEEEDSKASDDGEAQGPTGADSYEHSLTAAFADQLNTRNFSVTYAQNDIDSGEGMQLQYEETLEVNGTGGHQTIINADGSINEVYIVDGACYSSDENGELQITAMGNVMGDICSMVFGFSPAESEFQGAETYSDGTVQETFLDETNVTFVCTYADGKLTSCEGAGYLRDYKGFTEGGVDEIKLPEGN
ncbi:MAG: hypothetical protein J5582_03550 [Ruminococcus sp.]|uniref:hypothetical protein n=1 Tax=Ruminococcus sp. TaxID=41978 RepID=UPI0025CE8C57|nr:hypothetical protein [Ruminococcus sp.]MBO4865635.1 hypothetical protein [Ruminococcus sp.]